MMLQQFAAKRGDQESLLDSMNSKYYYYTRTKGLFRICYPKERPPTGKFLTTQEKTILIGSTVNKQKYLSVVFILSNSRNVLSKVTFSVLFHQRSVPHMYYWLCGRIADESIVIEENNKCPIYF
jgi:hypothetical protein